jgi:hypothetical protein
MTVPRKALCGVYALFGLLAFVGAWGNLPAFVGAHGFWGGTVLFWQRTLVNESSRFITVDLLFLALTVVVWMVLEARRLGIPGVWVYVVLGLLIAISLTVPLFMIQRELKLAAREPGSPAGTLRPADVVGIVVLGVISLTYAVVGLSR